MSELNFTEEDKQKFIDFLNMVAKHAKFDMNTVELVAYFKLLSHMQGKLLPKLDANILEIKRVIEAQEPPKEESKAPKGKK
jgi:hypothetical protein